MLHTSIAIREATTADAEALEVFARTTFISTFVEGFGLTYSPEDLAAFFAKSYTREAIAASIAAPSTRWLVAHDEDAMVGYATVGPGGLPHPEVRPTHGELKHLYVRESHQGQALGRRLLEDCLHWMEKTFDGPRWISVWSGNDKALRLYARYGFTVAGEYVYVVGQSRDRELILRCG